VITVGGWLPVGCPLAARWLPVLMSHNWYTDDDPLLMSHNWYTDDDPLLLPVPTGTMCEGKVWYGTQAFCFLDANVVPADKPVPAASTVDTYSRVVPPGAWKYHAGSDPNVRIFHGVCDPVHTPRMSSYQGARFSRLPGHNVFY